MMKTIRNEHLMSCQQYLEDEGQQHQHQQSALSQPKEADGKVHRIYLP